MLGGDGGPAVGVGVVLTDEDKILLIKRGHEPQRGKWTVPGGKVRAGESLREAARREMVEETGLDVVVHDAVWVGEVIMEGFHLVIIDYAGEVVGGQLRPGDDADEAVWIPLSEARSLPLTATMFELLDSLGV